MGWMSLLLGLPLCVWAKCLFGPSAGLSSAIIYIPFCWVLRESERERESEWERTMRVREEREWELATQPTKSKSYSIPCPHIGSWSWSWPNTVYSIEWGRIEEKKVVEIEQTQRTHTQRKGKTFLIVCNEGIEWGVGERRGEGIGKETKRSEDEGGGSRLIWVKKRLTKRE